MIILNNVLKGHRKNYIANFVSKERGAVSVFSLKCLISIPRLWYDSANNFNFLLYCFCMVESNLTE